MHLVIWFFHELFHNSQHMLRMGQRESTRTNVPKGTLTSLKKYLYKFYMNGGNVHYARKFHNVIYQSLFDVPIDQVNAFS